MRPAATAIQDLKKLSPDWNSYGAAAPDDRTVARALDCLDAITKALGQDYRQPEVRPIPDPGVSLTWRDRWRRGEVKVLVTPTSAEWVQLKNRHIVEQGSLNDAQQFQRFTRILSSVKV
jgi:hypothetical protein